MNHCVPDFETDGDYLIPARLKKSAMAGNEDIMELIWRNGQVVVQSQTQRSAGNKRPETTASPSAATGEIRSSVIPEEATPSDLFMQEDEMASWLHCPIDDHSFDRYLYTNDLLYPTPPPSASVTSASTSSLPPPSVLVPSSRPPIPPLRRMEVESGQPTYANFSHFSRPQKPKVLEPVPPTVKQTTVVESNETPASAPPESGASRVSAATPFFSVADIGCGGSTSGLAAAGTSSAGRETNATCELSVTSSPATGGLGASASMEPSPQTLPPATDDRKRKGIDTDDTESHGEDIEFEYPDAKKQSHGSSSSKRSRAAEVHNLSERRRRDRINEKMKALQELIPRCNKTDKASMLDEAIDYLKWLQMQVQMMAVACGMVPMMFPGVQQYVQPMGMGMGMGMGIGMDMGMNRAMVPYPAVLPGPGSAGSTAAHLAPQFPVPGFQMAPVVAGSQAAPMMCPFPQNPNQPRAPNFADPYQQYVVPHQTQLPILQDRTGLPPMASKPCSSKDVKNPEEDEPTGDLWPCYLFFVGKIYILVTVI